MINTTTEMTLDENIRHTWTDDGWEIYAEIEKGAPINRPKFNKVRVYNKYGRPIEEASKQETLNRLKQSNAPEEFIEEVKKHYKILNGADIFY